MAEQQSAAGQPAPAFHIDLGHFDLGHFDLGHLDLGHFDLGHFDLGHFDLGHIDLGHLDLGHFDLGHFDLGHFDLGHIDLGHFDLGHFDIGHFDLFSERVELPHNDVPFDDVAPQAHGSATARVAQAFDRLGLILAQSEAHSIARHQQMAQATNETLRRLSASFSYLATAASTTFSDLQGRLHNLEARLSELEKKTPQ